MNSCYNIIIIIGHKNIKLNKNAKNVKILQNRDGLVSLPHSESSRANVSDLTNSSRSRQWVCGGQSNVDRPHQLTWAAKYIFMGKHTFQWAKPRNVFVLSSCFHCQNTL